MKDILVIDDDAAMRAALEEALRRRGYGVDAAESGDEGMDLFGEGAYRMVISDMKMPGMDGMDVLRAVKGTSPETPVLLITAFGTVEKAVEAVKAGAFDFILKPFTLEALETMVAKALSQRRELESFETRGRSLITVDPAMRKIISMAATVAASDATVLINGESGTGKELLARFIHGRSPRAEKPFVAVNCASIPENLLESELFGHEKGAFTGAVEMRRGRFEQAQGGTILLDEISEMDLRLQAKLLRVIQEKEVERLGGKGPVPLDVRIVATTNRDMAAEVAEGRFREDLYYRLNIFPITLVPLRERPDDIVHLAEHFMRRFAAKYSKTVEEITPEALELLKGLPWKGNVRELENTMERAVLLCSGTRLEPRCFEPAAAGAQAPASRAGAGGAREGTPGPGTTISEMERGLILRTLDEVDGNRTRAAKLLGISVRTLRNKLKEYDRILTG
ncbi:MAG TPA: sigma-54-dependent Fis family transcriptional regulator [Deltaproteobacteria bacterium]|nr:sigma-54-dependent Fis family transcriptional regulator [Deltaproteobacteria bacterium]